MLNVARGGVVDEAALAEALQSGHLGGAGIDVFEHEPPTGSPLLDAPNTLLTPHLGASTAEAQILVSEEVAAQVLDVLDGRSARYAVNAPLLTPETARAIAPYLPLAEILGRFFAQFSRGGVRSADPRDRRRARRARRHAADRRGPARPARDLDDRAGQPRQRRALAKARGITVIERKTPDAGAFAALLTLSGEPDGRHDRRSPARSPAGEPRITRLDDYRLDMAPADVMLITRHMDRPGTVGRVGIMLGEADVNISAMHLARTRPREDALMILALDDDVPGGGLGRHPGRRRRSATCGRSGWGDDALTGDRGPLVPDGLDATLVLVRHGESTFIAEGRFQGQADSPLTALGRRQAALVADRLAAPHASPALPVPTARRSSSSIRRSARTTETAAAIDAARGARRQRRSAGPDPGFLEIGQGDWEGLHRDEITERYGRQLAGWRRRPPRPGPRAASRSPRSRRGSGRRSPRSWRALADGRAARHAATAPRSRATATPPPTIRGRSWSATTASSRSPC